jgi:hypothetical protein
MAYTATTWVSGTVLTAAGVNRIEAALSAAASVADNAIPTSSSSAFGRSLLSAADAANARNALAAPSWSTGIVAGTGLTGGGDLTVSRTLSLSAASIASLGKADTLTTGLGSLPRLGAVSKNLAGTDLNAFTENGWGAGNNLTNSPDGSTNFFYVRNHVNTAADNYFQQTAVKYGLGTNSGDTWVRYAEGSGVYTSWVKIADYTGSIDNSLRASITGLGGLDRISPRGAAISNLDLNNVTATGFYSGSTLTNAPVTGNGYFYVLVETGTTGTDWVRQTATEYATSAGGPTTDRRTWVRQRQSTTWGAWTLVFNSAGAIDPTARAASGVTSVATRTGAVILTSADLTDAGTTGKTLLQATTTAGARSTLSLDQVNNTSDVNKPVSTAQQAALDAKVSIATASNSTVYGKDGSGVQIGLGFAQSAQVGTLAQRDANGMITVGTVVSNLGVAQAAPRQYVDDRAGDKNAVVVNSTANGTVTLTEAGSRSVTYRLVITGTATLALPTPTDTANSWTATVRITQNATGGYVVTLPSGVKWDSGTKPTLSTGANTTDIVTFLWDGNAWYGMLAGKSFA